MISHYILDENGEPKPERDLLRWRRWFETSNRTLRYTEMPVGDVSTVFPGLDLDPRFLPGRGRHPVLWETMIFGGPLDGYQERYSSRAEALRGHREAVEQARDPGVCLGWIWANIRRFLPVYRRPGCG